MMKTRDRVFSIVCTLALLVCLLFSYEYVVSNTQHDCPGKDCTVCVQLEAAVHFISSIKILPMLSFIAIVLCVFTRIYAASERSACVRNTLVLLKVELLN